MQVNKQQDCIPLGAQVGEEELMTIRIMIRTVLAVDNHVTLWLYMLLCGLVL